MAQAGFQNTAYNFLWSYAQIHALRLSNQLPTRGRGAPEPWTNDPIFGSVCFTHVDKKQRSKGGNTGKRGLYIGHAPQHGSNTHLIYQLGTGKIVTARAEKI